ncbi:MAG: caspase family protein, partial [Solirubrobacteraceae bacterium]
SGHGDADALHLGDTRLPLRELEALVRGSPAGIRILVIDSCRSGSITRVKGGSPAPPLVIGATTSPLQGEGMIVLTASTLSEDAQESDQLGGSFFTHYLLSGLRGAADENGDHVITVAELFSYTHDQTVVASSRTLAGTQHPTFRYDLRGRADLALADLGEGSERGMLTLPRGATWLIMRIAPVRSVVGEVAADARQRTLSLRPGTYAVRGRARDALLEGTVVVVLGRDTLVEVSRLDRSTYAPLARKGEGAGRISGPFVGLTAQTLVFYGFNQAQPGFIAGWTFAGRHATLSPRVSATWSPSWNDLPEYSRRGSQFTFWFGEREIMTADLRAASPLQLGRTALDLGIVVGAGRSRVSDGFVTERYSVAHFDLTAGIRSQLWTDSYVGAEIAAQTYISFGQASAEHLELLTMNLVFGVRL